MAWYDGFINKIASKVAEKAAIPYNDSQVFKNPDGLNYNGMAPFLLKGVPTWAGQNNESFIKDGYEKNSVVYSCVNRIMGKVKLPYWYVYKVKNKAKAELYYAKVKGINNESSLKELRELKEQAFERFDGDDILNKLLSNPNPNMSFQQIVEQGVMFKLSTGNNFTYAKIIESGRDAGKPFELYPTPAQYFTVIADIEQFPAAVMGYQLYYGRTLTFERAQILHDYYPNPNWTAQGQELYGLSPLKAAAMEITRNNQANESVVAAYANMAPVGVLSVKANQNGFNPTDTGTGKQMQALKQDLANKSGSTKKGLTPVAAFEMVYTPMGFTPEDMEFINAQKWDKEQICSVFKVPPPLVGSQDSSTYNNIKTLTKSLIIDAVIPELNSFRDAFNRMMINYWGYKGTGLMVDYDPSCFTELEENRKELVDWLDKAWWLTPEQKLAKMDEAPDSNVPIEEYRKLYLPTNLSPLDDFGQLDIPE